MAEAFVKAAQRHDSEAVWPNYRADPMGKVPRDGVNGLGPNMRHSRMNQVRFLKGMLSAMLHRRKW